MLVSSGTDRRKLGPVILRCLCRADRGTRVTGRFDIVESELFDSVAVRAGLCEIK